MTEWCKDCTFCAEIHNKKYWNVVFYVCVKYFKEVYHKEDKACPDHVKDKILEVKAV